MDEQTDRDIGARLAVLENFLQAPVPSQKLLYGATSCILICVILFASFLLTKAIPLIAVTFLEIVFLGLAIFITMRYNVAIKRWRTELRDVMKDILLRLEFISSEVSRFITAFDDQTREHYHSLTQTKIRSYFILQEILQRVSTESNALSQALEADDHDFLLEIAETLLSPLSVMDSPLKGNEVVINRLELENFLGEISEELVTMTKQTLRDLKI